MNIKRKVKIFKALCEETRLLIVEELLKGEKHACKLPKLIGRTQSNTSMHLKKLQHLGIVKSRREGKSIIYYIANEEVQKVLSLF